MRRIASRQREAWIETAAIVPTTKTAGGIASRQREAWIETGERLEKAKPRFRIASRQREAWIETFINASAISAIWASPPGNGRRGLKQPIPGAASR